LSEKFSLLFWREQGNNVSTFQRITWREPDHGPRRRANPHARPRSIRLQTEFGTFQTLIDPFFLPPSYFLLSEPISALTERIVENIVVALSH
jgi:hypothetical protein